MISPKSLDLSLLPSQFVPFQHCPENYILHSIHPHSTISSKSLQSVLCDIIFLYKLPSQGVHYHNITHAFDVMTTLDQFLIELQIPHMLNLDPEDRTLILLAAFAHDNGHQGYDNEFYIKNDHQLALAYSYKSPLENMHSSNLIKLLKKHQLAIPMHKKKMMIEMILATDNIHHEILRKTLENIRKKKGKQNLFGTKQKQYILNSLLHAADINGAAKHPQLFQGWGEKIIMEFQTQKKIEQGNQYQLPTPLQINRSQLNFVTKLVLPFYKELESLFPEMHKYTFAIQSNIKLLEDFQNKETDSTI